MSACSLIFALLTALAQHASHRAQAPVGTWKYDVASVRVVPNAATQAKLGDPKQAAATKAMLAKIKAEAVQSLRPMRLVFKANRQFTLLGEKGQVVAYGIWNLYGDTIKAVAGNMKESTPTLELTKDKTRIHATFSDPGFGSLKTDLVRG